MSKKIGKVLATEKQPSTIDQFFFWTNCKLVLNPFDVVKVNHIHDSVTYGVVQEISHITDAASFLSGFISSDFGNLNTTSPTNRVGMNYVEVKVIGNDHGLFIPVINDSNVYLASKEEIARALGLENVKNPIVCGSIKMYIGSEDPSDIVELPVHLDSRFLIGPEAAHLSISGISGLAAKTSYAMFLLKALQENAKKQNDKIAFVVFNVKSKDLLSIDVKNDFSGDRSHQASVENKYKQLNLSSDPFTDVQYLYPCSTPGNPNSYVDTETKKMQEQAGQSQDYRFTYEDDKECLELLFSDVDDPNQTVQSILSTILNGDGDFKNVRSWDTLLETLQKHSETGNNSNKEIQITSWRRFTRYCKKAINGQRSLFADHLSNNNSQVRIEDKIKTIKCGQVLVIDIARLDSSMQSFVFGATMKYLAEYQLGEKDKEDTKSPEKFIIFIDELNKYASTDTAKDSPVLREILDITERGRSLGLILFGAEQFKSAIHPRITGNCSTFVYGRTNSIELSKKDYNFIPKVYQGMMTKLKPGEYIIQNPVLSSLLRIECPEPIYKQFKN